MSATRNQFLTRGRLVVIVVVLALAVTATTSFGLTSAENDGSEVVGIFKDASPLEVGSEVRSSGVKVGEVSAIELDGSQARVVLDVDDEILPLHSDASMHIRPINLLGENFVEVDPGSADKPALDGAVPTQRTGTIVTLQSLLDTFDDPTSAGLAALVSELGIGLGGQGENLAGVLKALGPAMNDIDRLGDVLRQQNASLNSLVEAADPVARAVSGEEGRRLDRLVAQARTTLEALAAEKSGIEDTIEQLPSTLVEARRTLDSLETVASSVAPTLRKARPVTGDLEEISGEIVEFSKYATPAFASFDEVFAHADRLLVEAAPLVARLNQAGPGIRRTTRNLRPIGDELLDQHLGDLMAFVRKWALSTNSRDNISHYFRGVVHVTPGTLNAMLGARAVPEVLGPGGDGDGNSDTVVPELPKLDLGGTTSGLLGQGGDGGLLGGLTGGPRRNQRNTSDADSATGLTSSQEQNLLGQLLGGGS